MTGPDRVRSGGRRRVTTTSISLAIRAVPGAATSSGSARGWPATSPSPTPTSSSARTASPCSTGSGTSSTTSTTRTRAIGSGSSSIFDASSVEEALTEDPTEVGYSQHAGGERADWDDDKLSKEGNHPIVFAASGSHASKFGSGVYLGWGEDDAGFGCDVTTGPSDRVEPEVILLPNDITQATGPTSPG